jgi:hypothetical protein
MLSNDAVIFNDYPYKQAPDVIKLTFGEVASTDEMLQHVLSHGVKRILDSIRDSEKKRPIFEVQCERADAIRNGRTWSRGGGGSIPEEEHVRRDVLAGWIMRWLPDKDKQGAEKLARKTDTALAEVGDRILRHKHGIEPSSEQVEQAASKVSEKVEEAVQQTMQARQADIDI